MVFGPSQQYSHAATEQPAVLQPAAFSTYEKVALGKQSVGFPPTLALARAAGLDAAGRALVHSALASVSGEISPRTSISAV